MTDPRLEQQIGFLVEIDKLKAVDRRSYLIDVDRRENSAEHSWHVILLAMILAEYADEPIDLLRVLKMLAIHDIVEIDAGDTFCYDEDRYLDKVEREEQAAQRLFGLLPEDQESELQSLWQEYEASLTPESRFANAMDRLMPLQQAYHTQGRTWQEGPVGYGQVLARNAPIGHGSSRLWEFARGMIQDAAARGYLAESEG
jgi:putative hydrolase of HD superfamily